MEKTMQEGPVTLDLITSNGQVALKATVSHQLADGVVGAKATVEIDLNAEQVLALAGGMLSAKFPSISGEVAALVGLAQGELAKI